jgi:hypothetical protein
MTTTQAPPETAPAGAQPDRSDIEAARVAGAEAADLVIRGQLDAGMGLEKIRESTERVLGDRFTDPTPASDAFYAAYGEAAEAMFAEERGMDERLFEPEFGDEDSERRDIEAG